MNSTPSTMVVFSLEVEGRVSALVIIAYSPLSLAVVRSSHFQETQFVSESFRSMSQNLCMSCLGCEIGVAMTWDMIE